MEGEGWRGGEGVVGEKREGGVGVGDGQKNYYMTRTAYMGAAGQCEALGGVRPRGDVESRPTHGGAVTGPSVATYQWGPTAAHNTNIHHTSPNSPLRKCKEPSSKTACSLQQNPHPPTHTPTHPTPNTQHPTQHPTHAPAQSLVLHEATSGLGGMTDAFAAALADAWRRSSSAAAPAAAAAAAAPGGSSSDGSSTSAAAAAAAATAGGLTHLEVAFTRYSLPSEVGGGEGGVEGGAGEGVAGFPTPRPRSRPGGRGTLLAYGTGGGVCWRGVFSPPYPPPNQPHTHAFPSSSPSSRPTPTHPNPQTGVQ